MVEMCFGLMNIDLNHFILIDVWIFGLVITLVMAFLQFLQQDTRYKI